MPTCGVGFEPLFGPHGRSGGVATQCGLRTVAKKAIALFVCGTGDCATLIRNTQSICTNASRGVACCTKCACNNRSSLSNRTISSRISICIRSDRVNTMARHRQRVAGRPNPRQRVVYACPSAPSLTGAGGQSVGLYGGRCVGVFGPAGLLTTVCPGLEPAPSATPLTRWRC
jgi:hypothetical protein